MPFLHPSVQSAPKQVKKSISYSGHEAEKVSDMEDYLMSLYGYDFSQLHKVLIREKYYQVRTLWIKFWKFTYLVTKNLVNPKYM